MQILSELFRRDHEGETHVADALHQIHPGAQFLAIVNSIQSELRKFVKGGMSAFTKICGIQNHNVQDIILVCNYLRDRLHGEPVDDRRFEMEHIIKILYSLPSDSKIGALLTKLFVRSLWNQLPHPSTNFSALAGYQWRSANGSNNNTAFPNIGKAGEIYVQDCISKRRNSTNLPEPGQIFDDLLVRQPDKNGNFRANASNISSNLFYMATLITHDLFKTNGKDQRINDTTSYLDLSPLYGWTKEMQDSVRTGINGQLKPDHFADYRLAIQPVGVTVLVVLLNRNHNYLATKLLEIDENGRFSSIKNDEERDEALFQTARLINERTYVNIILHDYLRVILGLNREKTLWTLNVLEDFSDIGFFGDLTSATGNQCSLEFNFLYRWHHATSIEDEKWVNNKFTELFGSWKSMNLNDMSQKLIELKQQSKLGSPLERNKDGRFDDKQLAKALIDGCKSVSGAFGGQNIPDVFRNIEISGILQGRRLGVCTLNEFREFLKLKKYESFNELNSELAEKLARLYDTVDDVELYPGLLCEDKKPSMGGSGLCANYTTSFAILSDAVALVRGDRFHSKHATYHNLTNFGMEDSQSNPNVDYGTLLGSKLISRHLGTVFKKNNMYAIFPFTLPSETLKNLGTDQSKYDIQEAI